VRLPDVVDEPTRTQRARIALPHLALGVSAAVLGLLPWLITGMRLPLQNLWATDTPPERMPHALLPFSQYTLTLIVAVIVVGAAIGGGLARWWRAHRAESATTGIAIGLVLTQALAATQSAVTVSNGLRDGLPSGFYVTALVTGTAITILGGLGLLMLIARASPAGAAIAVSIAAVAAGAWLNGIVLPVGTVPTEKTWAVLGVVRWVPAVLVGLAAAWAGLGTVGRAAGAVVSLLVLWIGPAVFTAVSAAAGSRVLLPYPAEMAQYGAQVFTAALGVPGVSLSLLVVAVAVMALSLALRPVLRRRRANRAERASTT
jgi:hypothetical protein